jgi:hypothetical protein
MSGGFVSKLSIEVIRAAVDQDDGEAASAKPEIETKRKAFLRKWRVKGTGSI